MPLRSLIFAGALALLSLPAHAVNEEFAAAIGKQGYSRCHMDHCGFFRISSAVPVKAVSDGTMFIVTSMMWGADYRATESGNDYDKAPISVSKPESHSDVVFCSKKRPATFFYDPEKREWNADLLHPGDESSIFGFNESDYQFYYAACHAFITKTPYGLSALAHKLGYRFTDDDKRDDDPTKTVDPLTFLLGNSVNP